MATVLTTAAVLAACTVTGTAQRGPLDLHTGTFTTTRGEAPVLSEVGERRVGAIRLGESLLLRTGVDAELIKPTVNNYPVSGARNLDGLSYSNSLYSMDESKVRASDTPSSKNLRYGYVADGHNGIDSGPASKSLQYAVPRYDSDRSARTAATELAEVFRTNIADNRRVTGEVTGLPDGESLTAEGEHRPIAAAFIPHGRDLLVANAVSGDARWVADMVRKTVQLQLKSMPPTEGLEEPRSAEDEELLARTLPLTDPDDRSGLRDYVGGPRVRAYLYFEPAKILAMFEAAGVDRIAERETEVYRAADPAKAKSLLQGYVQARKDVGQVVVGSPRDLSSAVCTESDSDYNAFSCSVAVDRYLAVASGETLIEAQQKISAQYLLLDD